MHTTRARRCTLWTFRLTLTILLLPALAAGVSGCERASTIDPGAPTAVVLVQGTRGSELVVVDLERFEIVRRVGLRSLCLSIDGDPASRSIVTAQCGGPGPDADDSLGIYDVTGGGHVTYVDLGVPNPSSVAVADGRAFVLHGFEQPEGLVSTSVDIARGRVAGRGHVGPQALRPQRAGGRAILPVAADGTRSSGLYRIEGPSALLFTTLPAERLTVLASRDETAEVVCAGAYRDPGSGQISWKLFRVAAETGALLGEAHLQFVSKAILEGCRVGDEVALADADGVDLSDPGRRILMLDAATLALRQVIEIDGMPAALGAWGERLLVVDGIDARLLLFEKGGSTATRSLDLGGPSGGTADLVVFD